MRYYGPSPKIVVLMVCIFGPLERAAYQSVERREGSRQDEICLKTEFADLGLPSIDNLAGGAEVTETPHDSAVFAHQAPDLVGIEDLPPGSDLPLAEEHLGTWQSFAEAACFLLGLKGVKRGVPQGASEAVRIVRQAGEAHGGDECLSRVAMHVFVAHDVDGTRRLIHPAKDVAAPRQQPLGQLRGRTAESRCEVPALLCHPANGCVHGHAVM
jgi:hypothetical protein